MKVHRFIGVLALAAASLAPESWAQSVWVVDKSGGPGSSFTDIQPAINAAADRDIILVRPGTYTTFSIAGKGLQVVADSPGTVGIGGTINPTKVSGLAPWQTVVLRGLNGFFEFTSNAGPIWMEECKTYPISMFTIYGVRMSNCSSVAIVRSTVTGSTWNSTGGFSTNGGNGVEAYTSTVTAYDSTFAGGNGSYPPSGVGYSGGHGFYGFGVSLYAARCTFKGGNAWAWPSASANGGYGLNLSGVYPVTALNCQFSGGTASGNGIPGAPIFCQGPFNPLTGPNMKYSVASPVREQHSIQFKFECGVAADVYLFLSPDPALAVDVPGIHGPLLLDLAAMGYVGFGVLPQGATTISIPLGVLPPTVQGTVLSTQAIFIDPNFAFIEVGTPSHLVLLDSVF